MIAHSTARPSRCAGADDRAAASRLQHRRRPRAAEPALRHRARCVAGKARTQVDDQVHGDRQESLAGQILHVRKQGCAITAQEMRRGFHAVAVPLRRHDGATLARTTSVAVWVEDASNGAAPDSYLAALLDEAAMLKPQLLHSEHRERSLAEAQPKGLSSPSQ